MRRIGSCVIAGLVAVLFALGGARAEADKETKEGEKAAQAKLPSPATVLQNAVKNLAAAKSYRTMVDIVGGYAEKDDHEVGERVVSEAYVGDIVGDMMHMSEEKAYRNPMRGAVCIDGKWRDILSDQRTVRIDRLFKFPAVILGRALKHAPKSGQWVVTPQDSEEASSDEAARAAEAEKEKKSTPKGKTVVVNKPKKVDAAPAIKLPRWIRVEAPPEEALNHIVEVQNSNCFGGG